MARQRFIHPELWTDPVFGRLKPAEQIMFIGLFSNADDEGRILADPAYLRSCIFPYAELKLAQAKVIRDAIVATLPSVHLYEVDGQEYIALLKWFDYQKPKYPKPSKLPAPGGKRNPARKKRGFDHGEIDGPDARKWVRRGYIKKDAREAVYARDGHRCAECGSEKNLQIDHIVPVSRGGSNEPDNLRTLCRSCNARKGDKEESFPQNRETILKNVPSDRAGQGLGWEGQGLGAEDSDGEEGAATFKTLDPVKRLLNAISDKDAGTEREIRKRVAQYGLGEGDLEEAREAALSPSAESPVRVAMSVLKARGEARAA